MSYSFDDLVERERRRWMQPWALQMMSPADRRADLERWRERLRHRDHGLWNYHAAHAQRLPVNASPQLTARGQIELSAARGAGPSLSELLKLKWDAPALRVQLAVIKHEIVTRKAQGLPPLTEADAGWQIILRNLARYEDACRKAGFNLDQPRVPAGNPDGGQWTSGSGAAGSNTGGGNEAGGGINDPRILSDATPDNEWILGARYAQLDSSGTYKVDLEEDKRHDGHTLDKHVGKSDEELKQVLRERYFVGVTRYEYQEAEGSFADAKKANILVNQVLDENRDAVDAVASGQVKGARIEKQFGFVTGKEAFRSDLYADPIIQDTYSVRVIIRHDSRLERGFTVLTAFPTNPRPRRRVRP